MAKVSKRRWTYNGVPKWKWVVRYSDARGKQPLKTFASKKAADAYRLKIENELAKGSHTPRSLSVTVETAAQAMLEDSKNKLRPEAQQNAEYHVRRFVVPLIGGLLLVDLTPVIMQNFVN